MDHPERQLRQYRLDTFARHRARVEVLVVLASLLAYFGVRAITEGSEDLALRNAERVVRLQEHLLLDWDMSLNQSVVEHTRLITVFNWIYTWGHWPVIFFCGIYLFVRFPRVYYRTRNAFLVSGAIGLVIFATFPVAPPRLTDLDVVDTVTRWSTSYRFLQPVALTNQYAAMPSLHFGWNLLIAVALVQVLRTPTLRILAGVFPLAMAAAVVITANHFVIDAIVGGMIALLGLVAAIWFERSPHGWEIYRRLVPASGISEGTIPARPGPDQHPPRVTTRRGSQSRGGK